MDRMGWDGMDGGALLGEVWDMWVFFLIPYLVWVWSGCGGMVGRFSCLFLLEAFLIWWTVGRYEYT